MTRRHLSLLAALLPLTLAACGLHVEAGGRFYGVTPAAPLTFSFDQESDQASGDPRIENNPFFEASLHEAIEWELALRGIHQGEGPTQLSVHHHLSLRDHDLIDMDEETYSYEEGAVVVHVVNAATREDVWVGWAYASVEPALLGPDEMRSWVYSLVGEMFESWPVPPRQ